MLTPTELPQLNAALNSLSAILLLLGFHSIKAGRIDRHRRYMLGALACSSAFLVSYLTYHWLTGSVPYPRHDWTRSLYFSILIPHIILATLMLPFIARAVWHAWHGRFQQHARITRLIWPVWMFVSISGVVIYFMLYRL